MAEYTSRVERCHGGVHRLEYVALIVLAAADRFGNDVTRERRHFLRVGAIRFQPCIQHPGDPAFHDGRTGRKRGQDGQHQAHRRVQSLEFCVAGERQGEVHALEIRPAVPTTVEDAVIGCVDPGLVTRPQPRFGGGIHLRMHRRGHQTRIHRVEHIVGGIDLRLHR